MVVYIVAVVWLLCVPLAYLLNRWCHSGGARAWTRNDRLRSLCLSVFMGPFYLVSFAVVAVCFMVGYFVYRWLGGDEPASW